MREKLYKSRASCALRLSISGDDVQDVLTSLRAGGRVLFDLGEIRVLYLAHLHEARGRAGWDLLDEIFSAVEHVVPSLAQKVPIGFASVGPLNRFRAFFCR